MDSFVGKGRATCSNAKERFAQRRRIRLAIFLRESRYSRVKTPRRFDTIIDTIGAKCCNAYRESARPIFNDPCNLSLLCAISHEAVVAARVSQAWRFVYSRLLRARR